MVEGIGNTTNIETISGVSTRSFERGASFASFDIEDKAIISAKAKMLNELEKYNAGESDEVTLALETVKGKTQIEANLRVFETKNDILKQMVHLGETEENR